MLDFNKVSRQVSSIDHNTLSQAVGQRESEVQERKARLIEARAALDLSMAQPELFAERMVANAPLVFWPLIMPYRQSAMMSRPIDAELMPWMAVAADGSQIMPSHHEVHDCYLLNAGMVRVAYGRKLNAMPAFAPFLNSEPELFIAHDELNPLVQNRRVQVDEIYVSLERFLYELGHLLEQARISRSLSLSFSSEHRDAGAAPAIVAFCDGSLIAWSAEKMPPIYFEHFQSRYLGLLEAFREIGVPLISYVSRSRSVDLVNALRVLVCHYQSSDCRAHCGDLEESEFACSTIWPTLDRQMLDGRLAIGQTSHFYKSGAAQVNDMPPAQQICFCYWNNGAEIARLEMPAWVVDDDSALQMVLDACHSQVQKGQGYPVVLAEAHHLAVIKGPERDAFFEYLAQHMVGLGIAGVRVSDKERQKRSSFV